MCEQSTPGSGPTAIRVDTDGTITELTWDDTDSLHTLKEGVGGSIELVSLREDLDMWVNEEGMYTQDPNVPATLLVRGIVGELSQMYFGPAVFTGGSDEEGNTLPIGDGFVSMINGDRF